MSHSYVPWLTCIFHDWLILTFLTHMRHDVFIRDSTYLARLTCARLLQRVARFPQVFQALWIYAYVTWLIHICDVTHLYVTWLIHIRGMIHLYVTWLIYMRHDSLPCDCDCDSSFPVVVPSTLCECCSMWVLQSIVSQSHLVSLTVYSMWVLQSTLCATHLFQHSYI